MKYFKTYNTFINENLGNINLDFINKLNGDQKTYYKYIYNNSKLIKTVDLKYDIQTTVKDCYNNAYKVSKTLNCDYVEGLIDMGGLIIFHAFNKIDNKYFDLTLDKNNYKYYSVFEINNKELDKFFDSKNVKWELGSLAKYLKVIK